LVLGLLCFCKSNWTWICILTVGNSPQRNNRVVLDCWKIGRRKFATAERVISMSSWRSEYFQVTQCNSSSCRWLTVHWFYHEMSVRSPWLLFIFIYYDLWISYIVVQKKNKNRNRRTKYKCINIYIHTHARTYIHTYKAP